MLTRPYDDDDRILIVKRPLARAIGLNNSIVLRQIDYWLLLYEKAEANAADKPHFKDGRWWVYNSVRQWVSDNFDFWSETTADRALIDLEKLGLLISTAEHNKLYPIDKTKWYSIDYDNYAAFMALWEEHGEPRFNLKDGYYTAFLGAWNESRTNAPIGQDDLSLGHDDPTLGQDDLSVPQDDLSNTRDYSEDTPETTKQDSAPPVGAAKGGAARVMGKGYSSLDDDSAKWTGLEQLIMEATGSKGLTDAQRNTLNRQVWIETHKKHYPSPNTLYDQSDGEGRAFQEWARERIAVRKQYARLSRQDAVKAVSTYYGKTNEGADYGWLAWYEANKMRFESKVGEGEPEWKRRRKNADQE